MEDFLDKAINGVHAARREAGETPDATFQVNEAIACALIEISETLRDLRSLVAHQQQSIQVN